MIGKRVIVVTSRGGSYSHDFAAPNFDLQEFYLKRLLGFIGLTDVAFIHAEHQRRADTGAESLAGALERISQVAGQSRAGTAD